jgi:hypothetical protein
LSIDLNLVRSADIEGLEELSDPIPGVALRKFRHRRLPLGRGVEIQKLFALENEVCYIQPIMTFPMQYVTKTGGDTHPSFLVDRMVKSTVEHRFPP